VFFSNVVMYFIILVSLRPLAGDAAKWPFALGVVGVGFLAVSVMTTGAAYDLSQTPGSWRHACRSGLGMPSCFTARSWDSRWWRWE
jgi:hypothetical protein